MKYTHFFSALAVAGLLTLSGCGRESPTNPTQSSAVALSPNGATAQQSPTVTTEHFTYTDARHAFISVKKQVAITSLFTAESLKNQNDQCFNKLPLSHYSELMGAFLPADQATEYSFGTWHIIVVANRQHYKTLDDFKADFSVCGPYGDLFPRAVSPAWLLFTSACPSGATAQATTAAQQCAEVERVVLPTLKLK